MHTEITQSQLQWQVCHAPPPPPPPKKKSKADLTRSTVLHIRELPHLHMKLAVWFSFPTTNNKNPVIPSWSLVSIYNYSFNPDQIFTNNFENLELEVCSKIFTCGICLGSLLDSAREIQTAKQMNGNQKWPSYCETYEMNFTDVGKVMMAFILATDFDFIAYMSKMAFSFFFWSFFHANGVFGIWFQWFLMFCMIYCITVTCHTNAAKQKAWDSKTTWRHRTLRSVDSPSEAQHEG